MHSEINNGSVQNNFVDISEYWNNLAERFEWPLTTVDLLFQVALSRGVKKQAILDLFSSEAEYKGTVVAVQEAL